MDEPSMDIVVRGPPDNDRSRGSHNNFRSRGFVRCEIVQTDRYDRNRHSVAKKAGANWGEVEMMYV